MGALWKQKGRGVDYPKAYRELQGRGAQEDKNKPPYTSEKRIKLPTR